MLDDSFGFIKFLREGLREKEPEKIIIHDALSGDSGFILGIKVYFKNNLVLEQYLSERDINEFNGSNEVLERYILEQMITKYDKEMERLNVEPGEKILQSASGSALVGIDRNGNYCLSCGPKHKVCNCVHLADFTQGIIETNKT